jgi:rhamnulokinase
MRYHLAIDIGASSGRHILGYLKNGKMQTEEVYRFNNAMIRKGDRLCWDVDVLFSHVLAGLSACKDVGRIPETVGIDTWGVDFVLLDANGKCIGDAVAYRDERGRAMIPEVEKLISEKELYARTGIQKLSFNTVYQLMAVKTGYGGHPNNHNFSRAERFLTIPDYLHYKLTGEDVNEYTIASTTALLDARTRDWDRELLGILGYPERLFSKPMMPGAALSGLTVQVRDVVGFDSTVVLPASHDTGCAFLAAPALDQDSVYLSSGTWSLLGVERDRPLLTDQARAANFTNEGGYNGRYRFLKNIMGLWMIQSIREELNRLQNTVPGEAKVSFAQLEQMAKETTDFSGIVDVNDESFLAPESMTEAVKTYCAKAGQPVPQTIQQVVRCVYQSLAKCYAQVITQLQEITQRTYTSINIIGGGSRDETLNRMTAEATGLPVYAGPIEGTALGNLLAQCLATGELSGVEQARQAVRKSFAIKKYRSNQTS